MIRHMDNVLFPNKRSKDDVRRFVGESTHKRDGESRSSHKTPSSQHK